MEKIDVLYLSIPHTSATLVCVGGESQIRNMKAFCFFQRENKDSLKLIDFVTRALDNQLYCYLNADSFIEKLLSIPYKRKIRRAGLEISESDWYDAALLARTEKTCEQLNITLEDAEEMQKHSVWRGKFEF